MNNLLTANLPRSGSYRFSVLNIGEGVTVGNLREQLADMPDNAVLGTPSLREQRLFTIVFSEIKLVCEPAAEYKAELRPIEYKHPNKY